MHYKWLLTTLTTLSSAVFAQQTLWGQCGGIGYTGLTTCISGATCVKSNDYYSQCLPSTTTTPAAAVTPTASSSARTSPPSGALVVRQSGTKTGEYSTLGAAIQALGSGTAAKVIFVYQGTYNERVEITYPGALTIYGYTTNTNSYTSNTVNLQHSSDSPTAGSLDNSATLRISTAVPSIVLYNINIKNTFGKGAQAVALSAKATKMGAYGCGFYGSQDTLYAAQGLQYYAHSYIEGATDYIFGNAKAWFQKCVVASNGGGVITANSREVATDGGWYVFESCPVRAADGATVAAGSVYLGRPWRVLARVLYQRCQLSNIVNSKGWTTMAEGATPLYYEYQNTGAGAATSGRQFLTGTTTTISKSTLFGGDTSWIDASYPA